MKSATSLLNKALLRHFMGSVFWLTVLYLIGNILVQPFVLWILSTNMNGMTAADSGYLPADPLDMAAPFQLGGGMIYAVLLALFLFNYRNKEDAIDFMHSLPVKKHKIMSHAILAGIIHITVPLLITTVILFFERYILNFDIALADLFLWLIYSLFVIYTVFAISIFTGMFINSIFNHLQLVLIIFFLPVIFWGLNVSTAGMLFDGITEGLGTQGPGNSGVMGIVMDNTFPVFAIQQIAEGYELWKMILWVLLAVVLVILSYMLYSRSENENVHHNFNHAWVRNTLAALISITGMLLLGIVISFAFAFPVSIVITVLAFVTGLLFSYIVTEMFFQRTARINFKRSSIITALVFLAAFWALFIIGWNQYVSYVPPADEVAGVSLSADYSIDNYGTYSRGSDAVSEDFLYMDDRSVIESTRGLHQHAIDSEEVRNHETQGDLFIVSYKMKDGSYVNREFSKFEMDPEMRREISGVVNDSRHAEVYDILFNIEKPEAAESVEIRGMNGLVHIDDKEEVEAFIRDYQTEALQMPESPLLTLPGQNTSLAWTNVYFSRANYYGDASVYNEALLERITAVQELTDYLGLNDAESVYAVSLSDDEKEAFFRDYDALTFSQLENEYGLEEVQHADKDVLLESINEGGLDVTGDKVLLYKPAGAEEFYSGNEEEAPELEASAEYMILGIE